MKMLYGRIIMCERVGLGKMSECGENRHTKIWIAQL